MLTTLGILASSGDSRFAIWDTNHMGNFITISPNKLAFTGSGGNGIGSATIGKSADRWTWEIFINSHAGNTAQKFGIINAQPADNNTGLVLGTVLGSLGYRGQGFCTQYNFTGTVVSAPTGCTVRATGDVYTFALSLTDLTLDIYKNSATTGISIPIPAGTWYPACASGNSAGTCTANFGQNAWDSRTATLRTTLEGLGYNLGLYNE